MERDAGVQVLSRAAEMLRLLTASPAGLTQAEIADEVGLARTTVHRILNALAAEGLVDPSGPKSRYRLGAEIMRMAEAARSSIVSEIHPQLQGLSRRIGETVDLSVLDHGQMTFIDQVVAPQRLRAVSVVGASFPLHCTANGKAVLAEMQTAQVNRLLPTRLQEFTAGTLTTAKALREELAQVRKQGFALDSEEHSEGISAIGVVVRGTPLGAAAISVPIPTQRFAEKQEFVLEALQETARRIEESYRADR